MKKIAFSFFLFVLSSLIFSQSINMGAGISSTANYCGYTFYDSGGSAGNYANSQNITVTICAPAGQYLTINFTAFSTEATFDVLSIYNGGSTASPLIGNYSGSNSPGSITTTQGGCITIKFVSDGSIVSSGWAASISCSNNPPASPGPIINFGSNIPATTGACGATFYDAGGPNGNYLNNQNVTATFCAPAGQYLTINFTSFNIESGWDFLNIYNGPSAASPLIGAYTGVNSPGSITTSMGGCITINFTSDGIVNASGWAANISCSPTPPPPPPPPAPSPTSCASAQPFCTSVGANFPAGVNTTAPVGPNYGCLFSQPNPAWYFLNIATPGNININLSNSANVDIDFAAWGPFTSQAAMCAAIFSGTLNPLSCSFSTASNETVILPNTQVGQWYMVLITNFANVPTNISATAAGGNSGTTNCNILCNMTNLTAVPGACNPATGQYQMTGQINFTAPPTSGVLTVSSTCGASMTIPAPWVSPISYTLPGLTANGGACSLSAGFSADATCSLTVPYTAPASCSGCTVLASNNGPICAGSNFNLTSSTITNGAYSWVGPNGFTSNQQNPLAVTSPTVAGTYIYTVNVTTASGVCTKTTAVVVNPKPVITATGATVCIGSVINLGVTAASTYVWSGPNSYNSNVQNPVINNATLNMNGNYTVLVTSSQGCTNTAVANVSIVPSPTVSVSGTNTLCSQNFNGSINTTLLNASGATNYTWTLPTGYSASPNVNSSNITVTVPVTNIQTVATLTVLGASGSCTNTALYTLTVMPNPTITVTSASMCAGTSVTLTASGANTFTWTPPTALSTTNGTNVVASPISTTVYSVNGTNLGCNSQTQNSTVTVVANPTVTITPPLPVICIGNSVLLTAGGATSYTWSPNSAITSTNTANTTANPTITTTYTVLASQATCTNLASITVTVLPSPTVTIVSSSPTLCMNNYNGSVNTVTLTSSGAASYTWGPINGLTTNTLNGSTIIGTSNGIAVITGTVIGANASCTNSATFSLNAIPNPIISVSSASLCSGTSATLTANGANTYTWSPSTALSATNGSSVISNPNATTIYSVIGSAAGCNSQTQTSTLTVVATPTIVSNPATPIICIGNTISLTASGALSYTWTPNTALTSTNTALTIANPTTTTTYTVIGAQSTCTNLASITVTVLPSPTITVASSSPTLCINNYNGSVNTVTLTSGGATSYTWGPISGLTTNTLNGSTIIGTSNGIAIGSVTVIGANGTCTNLATFTVNGIPNPTLTVGSASMCAGASVTLTATGATTFSWSPATALNLINGAQVISNPNITTVYSVIGTSLGCNSQTQNSTVTVVSNPTITITPLNPVICLGNSISLTASGASNYTWTPNSALTTTNAATTSANPTITTTYSVLASQSTCTNIAAVTVTALPLPNPAITSNTPCAGSVLNLSGSGGANYLWLGPNGFSSNLSNPTISNVTTLANGNYSLIAIAGTCSATVVQSISINPLPNVTANNNAPVCETKNLFLIGSGGVNYSWTGPLGFSSSVQSPSITNVLNTNSGSYVLTVTDANGCQSSATTSVNVLSNPSAIANGATVCFGQPASINASGGVGYQWYGPNGFTSNLANPVIPVVNNSTSGNYTVVVSGANTCTSITIANVVVNPLSIPSITATSKACVNTLVNLQGSPGFILYQWNGPNNFLSNQASTSFTAGGINQSGIYILSVTDAGGCMGTASVNIIIDPLPDATLISDVNNNCVPFCANFSLSAPSSPIINTTWQINSQALVNPSINYCFNKEGNYLISATFTDANGCSNSGIFNVNAYPPPVADFEFAPLKPIENDTVFFTNTSSGQNINGWKWYFIDNNGATAITQNTSYTFKQDGMYSVAMVVKNKWGCMDTVVKVILVNEAESFYVPNAFTPNGDGLNEIFSPKARAIKSYSIIIFDRWGQKIFESNDFSNEWDGTFKGKECKEDVYVWKINYINSKNKLIELTGHVSLIR